MLSRSHDAESSGIAIYRQIISDDNLFAKLSCSVSTIKTLRVHFSL